MDAAWARRRVHELPPAVFFELARILDSCDSVCGTRQFAAHVLDDQMKVRELENSRRGHSMAEEVLWLWAQKNATVQDLLQVLVTIENHRCVEYLQQELVGSPGENRRRSIAGDSPPVQPTPDPGAEKGHPGALLLPPHPPSHSFCSVDCYKRHVQQQPQDSSECPGRPSALPLPRFIQPQGNPSEDVKINNLSQPPCSNVSAVVNSSPSMPVPLHPELDSRLEFSHEMVCAGTQNFSEARKLGEGGLGTVYRAYICQTDYAAKLLKEIDGCNEEGVWKLVESEARNLSQFRHPNIIVLAGYSQKHRQCCLVYELAVNGSLSDRLQCAGGTAPLPWRQRLTVAVGLARAVLFMHTSQAAPVIHGNIRSSKVLLTESLEPKLGGFGFASLRPSLGLAHDRSVTLTTRTSLLGGQLAFLPDEFLKDGQLSTSLDVYSCGVVLLELLSGIKAYDASRRPTLLKDLVMNSDPPLLAERLQDGAAGEWPARVSSAMLALARRCIGTRKSRPLIREVFEELEILLKGQFADHQNTFPNSALKEACAEPPQQRRAQHRKPAEMTDVRSAELPRAAGPCSLKAGSVTGATRDAISCTPLVVGSLHHEQGACADASNGDIFQAFPHEDTGSLAQLQSFEAPFRSNAGSWGFVAVGAKYSRAPVESLDPGLRTDSRAARADDGSSAREPRSETPTGRPDGAKATGGGRSRVEHGGAGDASEALSRLSVSRTGDAAAGKHTRERSPGSGAGEAGSCTASSKAGDRAEENVALRPRESDQGAACGSYKASDSWHAAKGVEINPAKVRMMNKIQMYMEGRIDTAELVSLDADQAPAEEHHSS